MNTPSRPSNMGPIELRRETLIYILEEYIWNSNAGVSIDGRHYSVRECAQVLKTGDNPVVEAAVRDTLLGFVNTIDECATWVKKQNKTIVTDDGVFMDAHRLVGEVYGQSAIGLQLIREFRAYQEKQWPSKGEIDEERDELLSALKGTLEDPDQFKLSFALAIAYVEADMILDECCTFRENAGYSYEKQQILAELRAESRVGEEMRKIIEREMLQHNEVERCVEWLKEGVHPWPVPGAQYCSKEDLVRDVRSQSALGRKILIDFILNGREYDSYDIVRFDFMDIGLNTDEVFAAHQVLSFMPEDQIAVEMPDVDEPIRLTVKELLDRINSEPEHASRPLMVFLHQLKWGDDPQRDAFDDSPKPIRELYADTEFDAGLVHAAFHDMREWLAKNPWSMFKFTMDGKAMQRSAFGVIAEVQHGTPMGHAILSEWLKDSGPSLEQLYSDSDYNVDDIRLYLDYLRAVAEQDPSFFQLLVTEEGNISLTPAQQIEAIEGGTPLGYKCLENLRYFLEAVRHREQTIPQEKPPKSALAKLKKFFS